ncbi:hypothetical protein [Cryobacterium psychrophilum]|uniref:CMP/dCMP-type deaminase domain-containing protein n=1 Tax=Cryobacterium psychrophilum TaxID=41988 RepID=A0A4Y8KML3_9MICO|nr:hypothetical protein [Cryobacterium psychrophilum]TDW29831.1 cytidine deaminase [Cryobacterium psychrophilum]TFD76783.1 hypothetical protein E3T53_12995 [Cryobacterium psychrophilum]
MNTVLDPLDIDLYRAASRMLLASHHADNHRVASAIRGASGTIYLGLHLGSKRVNICAESSAIANARMAGETHLSNAVAVCMNANTGIPQVVNPCGVCRELFSTYGPDMSVLVDAQGTIAKVTMAELLPLPWMRANETDWVVPQPTATTA